MWVVLLMSAIMFGVVMDGTSVAATQPVDDDDDLAIAPEEDSQTSMPSMLEDDAEQDEQGDDDRRVFSVGSGDTVAGGAGDDVFLLDPDTEGDQDDTNAVSSINVSGGSGDDVMQLHDIGAFLSVGGGSVSGDAGDDQIVISGESLSIDGGAGDDTIQSPEGAWLWDSTIQGGAGNDTLDINVYASGTGATQVDGGAGNDLIDIRDASNVLAMGGDGNDTIHVGPELEFGGTGYVTGGNGGAGDDLLVQDADLRAALEWRADQTMPMRMTGGEGADIFQITTLTSSGLFADSDDAPDVVAREWMRVEDFEVGTDMIVFDLSSTSSGPYSASTAQMVEDSAAGETQVSVLLEADGLADQEPIINVAATGLDWNDVSFAGAAPGLAAPLAA